MCKDLETVQAVPPVSELVPGLNVDARPALHISHVVRGREWDGQRVTYLLDPKGVKPEREIPEQVVLHRWRQRRLTGYAMSGTRLAPSVWRAVGEVFGRDAQAICLLTKTQVEESLERLRKALRDKYLKAPHPDAICALFEACGPTRLQALIDRHTAPGRGTKSGVPDLFLYARQIGTSRLVKPVFVEVKKPGERVSPDQRSEISFMVSLGLRTRVLVLMEA